MCEMNEIMKVRSRYQICQINEAVQIMYVLARNYSVKFFVLNN